MKQLRKLMVALIAVLGINVSLAAENAVANMDWYNETATSFTLTTAGDLVGFAQLVNGGNSFAGKTVTLDKDIDLSGLVWSGIGVYSETAVGTAFQGIFDGNGKKISGVTFEDTGSNKYRGFFNQIYRATIKNVTIEGNGFGYTAEDIASVSTGMGGAMIVGHAISSTIEGCVAEGSFVGTHNVAGIVVLIQGSTIKNCTNKANLTGNYSKLAGIVNFSQHKGVDADHKGSLIEGCINEGTITSTERGENGVGGIIGWIGYGSGEAANSAAYAVTIKDCENKGAITGTSAAKVGQIVGSGESYIVDGGSNKGLTTTYGIGDNNGYFAYATVENDVATYTQTLTAGNTYLVTAPNTKPVIKLGFNESVTFDTSRATIDASGITADVEIKVTPDGSKTTYKAEVTNWIQVADATWYNDSGTEFTISTAQELAGLITLVNGGNTLKDKTITLTADIDLSGTTLGTTGVLWDGIGVFQKFTADGKKPFEGTFNGNNKTISKMTFSNGKYRGLFNLIMNGAVVKDLTVAGNGFGNSEVPQSGEFGGAFIAGGSYGATIQNCVAEGTLITTHNTAGIAVTVQDTTIDGCTSRVNITCTADKFAGIACLSENNSNETSTQIKNSVNDGSLYVAHVGAANDNDHGGVNGVGGIVGYLNHGASKGWIVIENCTNKGAITKIAGNEVARIGQIAGYPNAVISPTGNKGLTTTLAAGANALNGLTYATVAEENGIDVATYVKSGDLTAGGTYFVTAKGAKPVIALKGGDSITFDASLITYDASGITAASVLMDPKTDGNKTTYTAALVTVGSTGYTSLDTALAALETATDKTVTIYGAVTFPADFTLTEDVAIKLADGVTDVKAPIGYEWSGEYEMVKFNPNGSIGSSAAKAFIVRNHDDLGLPEWVTLYTDVSFKGQKSLELKLYSGDKLLGISALKDDGHVLLTGKNSGCTAHFFLNGSDPEWWTTTLAVDHLLANEVPDKMELWIDDVKVDEGSVYLSNSNDNMGASTIHYNWGDLDNVMVAKIDVAGENGKTETKYYDTLQEAIDAAAAGETVTLIGNTKFAAEDDKPETQAWVKAEDNVIIDLNQNTVDGAFFINGTATIQNGVITNGSMVSGIETKGTLTLKDLTVVSDRHGVRVSGGTTTIESGTYQTLGTTGTRHAINASGADTVLIIQGGTFYGAGYANLGGTGNCVMDNGCKTVTISGGTFLGANGVEGPICADDGLVISGGTFCTWSYDNYLVDGKCADLNGEGLYEVVDAIVENVTTKKKHGSLQAAFDAANAGDEIKLLANVTINAEDGKPATHAWVKEGQSIVVDLDGKTVAGAFYVDGKATIKNGSIVNTSVVSCIESKGDLTLEDMTLTSNRHGLRISGGEVTIVSGVYQSTATSGTKHAVNISDAKVTIKNGTFKGYGQSTNGNAAIAVRGNSVLTIEGGDFSNDGGSHTVAAWGGVLNISGGVFHKAATDTLNMGGGDKGTSETGITGGIFEDKPDTGLLQKGKAAIQIAEGEYAGWYEITTAVAMIDEEPYATFAAALEDAKNGDTVKVLISTGIEWADDFTLTEGVTITLADGVEVPSAPTGYVWENKKLVRVTNWIQVADTKWYNDTDTKFEISTAQELAGLAKLVNEGNSFEDKTIALTVDADIDLGAYAWTPIGTNGKPFSGNFDGQGATVRNLLIDESAKSYQGLFGQIKDNAEAKTFFKNVTLTNVRVTGMSYVAGLIADAFCVDIDNCHVNGDIHILNMGNNNYTGAIVGHAYANFTNCSAKDTGVDGKGSIQGCYSGGIVGWSGEGNYKIADCEVENIDFVEEAGTIVGLINSGVMVVDCSAKNCTITANTGSGLGYTGLIAGDNRATIASPNYVINNTLENVTGTVMVGDVSQELTQMVPANENTVIGSRVGFDTAPGEIVVGTSKITRGTFTARPPESTLATRAFIVENENGTYTVWMNVAEMGDTKYTSLQAAIDAALDANGGTVKLLADTDESVRIEKSVTAVANLLSTFAALTAAPQVTLDLNGYMVAQVTVPAGADLMVDDSAAAQTPGKIEKLVLESGAVVGKTDNVEEAGAPAPTGYTWIENVLTANAQTVDISIAPAGSGTVEGAPTGVVKYGDKFTLKAIPEEGYVFAGWTGDFTELAAEIEVKVAGDVKLTANFVPAALYTSMTNQVIVTYKKDNELISIHDIQNMSVQNPTIEVKDGTATVGIQLMYATTLKGENGKPDWDVVPMKDIEAFLDGATIKVALPVEGSTRFFRFIPVNGLEGDGE